MGKNENMIIIPRDELPPEILLFHILPKLPAKSLFRFRCVCKQWRSFLATPIFAKIHLHHVTTTRRHEKLIFFNNSRLTSLGNFQTIDLQDGSIGTPRCHPFQGLVGGILTSCVNGLVCVGIWKNPLELFHMILWNPLTNEYKTLSTPVDKKCYICKSLIALELYYTCSDDDYKILCINMDRIVYIYSLKSDSWRKLESRLDYDERIPYYARDDHHHNNNNSLDDKLHFLMKLETRYIIISLDLKTEKFTKIAVPSTCPGECLSLMDVRGCNIRLTNFKVDFLGTWTIEEWQMDGDGDDWMKVANSICSIHEVDSSSSFLPPLYLLRNGNWLWCTTYDICKGTYDICKVDPEKNTIDHLYSNSNIVIFRRAIYIETFVSLSQYTH